MMSSEVFITMKSVTPILWATTADRSYCGCTWQTQTQSPFKFSVPWNLS